MLLKFLEKIKFEIHEEGYLIFQSTFSIETTNYLKQNFSDFEYVSFQDNKTKNFIQNDPHRFFKTYSENIIFDFIEFIPDFMELVLNYSMIHYQKVNYLILSYSKSDLKNLKLKKTNYLSQQVDLSLKLKTFQYSLENLILNLNDNGNNLIDYNIQIKTIVDNFISKKIQEKNKNSIKELLILCANAIGKPINVNELAKKLKLTQPTVAKLIDLLVDFAVLIKLNPLELDFGKRTIKSPKIYFSDTGLAAFLLKIYTPKTLNTSEYFDLLFDNFIITLLIKNQMLESKFEINKLFYWKNSNGHEVKFGIKNPTSYDIFEFISSPIWNKKHSSELEYFDEISEGKVLSKSIIYSGYKFESKENLKLIPWTSLIENRYN
jgi:uncharacterized protein